MAEKIKRIILSGEFGSRPEVICISDNDENLKKAIEFVKNSTLDYYYLYPLVCDEIYTGPWGLDDGDSWIEKGNRNKEDPDKWEIKIN